jgi:hypothetical protein
MKKRKPKISDKKLRGEWAEMRFMVRAAEHGLHVSKPWGEMQSYDFIVGRPHSFVSVQVNPPLQRWITVMSAPCAVATDPMPPVLLTFSRPMSCSRTSGTSSLRKKFRARGASHSIPNRKKPSTTNIARHGICCDGRSSTATFRLARRNFPVRHFFLLFLRFPQGILVLHSLCTTRHEISVADILRFKQSTASANVRCLESAV